MGADDGLIGVAETRAAIFCPQPIFAHAIRCGVLDGLVRLDYRGQGRHCFSPDDLKLVREKVTRFCLEDDRAVQGAYKRGGRRPKRMYLYVAVDPLRYWILRHNLLGGLETGDMAAELHTSERRVFSWLAGETYLAYYHVVEECLWNFNQIKMEQVFEIEHVYIGNGKKLQQHLKEVREQNERDGTYQVDGRRNVRGRTHHERPGVWYGATYRPSGGGNPRPARGDSSSM